MDEKRATLHHFLAALAYRTQKAVREAPASYAGFRAAPGVRTPHEIVVHMESVLGYARTFFEGGVYRAQMVDDFSAQLARFHAMVESLASHLIEETPLRGASPERMLQGPFSDAMTHVGQLALLRRLAGSPVPPENFIEADVRAQNLGQDQPLPVSPDQDWPEKGAGRE